VTYRENQSAWCYQHPSSQAGSTCTRCLRPICDACTIFHTPTDPHCPTCLKQARRTRGLFRAGVAVVVLGALGTAGFFAYRVATAPPPEKPFDYGEYTEVVRTLEDQVEREPCNKEKTHRLMETMLKATNYRGVVKRGDVFFGKCGPYPKLLWFTYTAHRELNEHDAAIVDATKLIDDKPNDHDFWWWRGIMYEQKGDLKRAAADYEKAISITPGLNAIPFNLATVYERMKRPCDAVRVLKQYLEYHPFTEGNSTVTTRIERLRKEGDCD